MDVGIPLTLMRQKNKAELQSPNHARMPSAHSVQTAAVLLPALKKQVKTRKQHNINAAIDPSIFNECSKLSEYFISQCM